MDSLLKVGIDVGSTTIKLVVLDHEKNILYKNYARHFSEIGNALQENLTHLKTIVGERKFSFALTGSAGMGIAQRIGLPFVQEVIACATAVRELIPQTDTVVELGGEDAKITYFGDAPEQRMNGVCAGGTGSFIDHMASLLSTDAPGLNALAAKGKQIYTIASRCGVFAKTDIQALMNDGAEKADIALSIFQAVVNQTIGNLAQGRPIDGKVAFLGGPLHFLPELKKRFIETLKLDSEHVVAVDYGNYFVAMGSALSDEAKNIDVAQLETSIERAKEAAATETRKADFTLFDSQEEYEAFKRRHDKDKVKRGELTAYEGPVYVGIDAGSTTTKITAIGRDKEILYTSYGSNQGSPLTTVVREFKELYKAMPESAWIAGTMTTGYGEAIVKAAIHADGGEVETFAHLRAAQEFCPEVTFVLDIGGQDMKCFFVKDGSIGNITLNEACSAGCGSFIQNFAEGLHMTPAEFAKKALTSKAPVDLGTRCTVFMNSKVKQAQKEGAEVADISAGIAFSVIKNALFKVMQLKDVRELGDHIVVQGGTFYNDAVLRCMEKLLDRDVIRPDIAGLMGAYGAAILALETGAEKSAVLSVDELQNFTVDTSSYRCKGCGNKCLITMQKFPDGSKYFTGNRCERGVGGEKQTQEQTPNIYKYKYDRVFKYYKPQADAERGRIGIPRVLNMYEDYPFWFTFLDKLGYEVVLSGKSSAKMYYKGMATVPSDSLCYPAKITHGHIVDLIEKGVKKIFYPCEPYNMEDDVNESDNHFNCPIVASYAENIRGNMDILREQNIDFIQPFLPIHDKKRLIVRLYEELGRKEGISKQEIAAAVEAAYKEIEQYRQDVRDYGAKILARIEKTGEQAILLVGRPYHVDPEINHGIPEMIQSYKLPILSEDAVYHLPVKSGKLKVVNQWSYHARLYHAAQFVAEHDNLTLIQFSSFGCGLDALTTGQCKEILEQHHRIYTMIKLDEVSNLGAARIRLRSLMAALTRRTPVAYKEIKPIERPRFTEECKATHTILAPQMAPIHFELFKTAIRKYGYNVVIPPMPGKEAIDTGLRYVNNDMCYPAIVVIGQLIQALKSGLCDPNHTSIMLFQTCGACRATNYLSVLREALKYAGYPQVPVFAVHGLKDETDAFNLDRAMLIDAIKAAIYGDTLMNVRNRMMPYETTQGATQALSRKWMDRCKAEINHGSYFKFKKNIKAMVRDFDNLPIDENLWKPKVGIVGEILVKYHPVANNHIEKVLMDEGAEVVMPDFVDFFLYSAYDSIAKHKLLAGKYKDQFFGKMFIKAIEFFRKPMRKALKESKHFTPPHTIYETAELAARHVSLGNMAGEGWFLTGEMVKLIDEGVPNVVCLQPFGCLPNHITGKGVMHELRTSYKGANITAIDCDAGSSEVNQLNRLKLMLAVAKERGPKQAVDEKIKLKQARP
ncbi:CoA-substrate-specific enzyme activase, putative [Selenomonas sp. WCT3]|uniref:2-hydroxyacyl-CoA dehydratase n=1 Tax=Selenomonas sp. WCT3 TaxID=3158785 RepID=UPI000889C8F3|nr:CoA-substrate-specific enzyme activase, putative [Selenomonas ruminantium]